MLIFFANCLIMILLHVIKLSLKRNSWLYKKLDDDNLFLFFAKILCIFAPGVFYPFGLIILESYSNNFHEKLNICLHVIFAGLNLLIPVFLSTILVEKAPASERLNNLHTALINILPAFFIGFYKISCSVPLFLFFVFFLHCLGIYEAKKRKRLVLNATLINSYFLVFHIGYIAMWISKGYIDEID